MMDMAPVPTFDRFPHMIDAETDWMDSLSEKNAAFEKCSNDSSKELRVRTLICSRFIP